MFKGSAWAVLRHRDFRWFFMLQFVSLVGSYMQLGAVNWQVWQLSHNELALGLVGLARIIPLIVFALFGGVLADAFDRRKVQLVTQTAMLLIAAIMAVITISGHASLPILYLLTAVGAGFQAFDQPSRRALMTNLVPKEEIGDIGRLNVLLFQLSSMLGFALAGVVLGLFGEGICYAVNAISFVPIIIVLVFIRPRVDPSQAQRSAQPFSFGAMRDGLRYVFSNPILWSSMLLDFFATFFASAQLLLPVYATDILHVNAFGYGLLSAGIAIGATIGASVMIQLGNRISKPGIVMLWAVGLFGLATVLFGLSQNFWLSLFALALSGLTDAVSTSIRGPMRDLFTADEMRGRMVSINMIFFMGGPQLGEFEAGLVARVWGAPFSVISGGIATVFVVGVMAWAVPVLRQYKVKPVV